MGFCGERRPERVFRFCMRPFYLSESVGHSKLLNKLLSGLHWKDGIRSFIRASPYLLHIEL